VGAGGPGDRGGGLFGDERGDPVGELIPCCLISTDGLGENLGERVGVFGFECRIIGLGEIEGEWRGVILPVTLTNTTETLGVGEWRNM